MLLLGCKNTIIPEDVLTINDNAFNGCTGLTSFVIPEGVTSIGPSAFYDCVNLQSISIPSTVTEIHNYVFEGANSLTSVTIANPVPPELEEGSFPNRFGTTLYVPSGSLDDYKSAQYWKEFGTIEEMVEYIAGDANGDGVITVADYIAIAHYIMGNPPANFNEKAADANGDGQINVADYIAVAHIIMNNNNQ
jgi:hypothetical protein